MRKACAAVAAGLLLAVLVANTALAAARIRTISEVIENHQVGGVAVDALGYVYVADFAETVWKLTPEFVRQEFASGLYGASGNTIDSAGNLLQSSFYGNSITRIDRKGGAVPLVTAGLYGPVGVAIHPHTAEVYVANCRGNTLAKVAADGSAVVFARSELFKCPNGLAFDREGNLYTVNFRNNRMFKVDSQGTVAEFATVSEKGLGHLCFKDDRFYVTAYASHEIYEVTLTGKVKRILGNGERGTVDGAGADARLSFPNGIACHPWVRRLYINEYLNDDPAGLPRRVIIREITLDPVAP
ncbi:MAG TPA: SMP-30/gluconolactonase/LRE family protein [Steroidobacteraceae bacterium]|jgi:DNA-binding beta-propeller fold protein YncE|nr:SMP-30/gluconolactonase/LRE family protein [Steroidobacteraceae bacterium]